MTDFFLTFYILNHSFENVYETITKTAKSY